MKRLKLLALLLGIIGIVSIPKPAHATTPMGDYKGYGGVPSHSEIHGSSSSIPSNNTTGGLFVTVPAAGAGFYNCITHLDVSLATDATFYAWDNGTTFYIMLGYEAPKSSAAATTARFQKDYPQNEPLCNTTVNTPFVFNLPVDSFNNLPAVINWEGYTTAGPKLGLQAN